MLHRPHGHGHGEEGDAGGLDAESEPARLAGLVGQLLEDIGAAARAGVVVDGGNEFLAWSRLIRFAWVQWRSVPLSHSGDESKHAFVG